MSSKFSHKKRLEVFKKSNGLCELCGCELHMNKERSLDKYYVQIDHVLPKANGGTNDISNLRALCKRCNSIKCNYSGKKLAEHILKLYENADITKHCNKDRLIDDITTNQLNKSDIEELKEVLIKQFESNIDFFTSLIDGMGVANER